MEEAVNERGLLACWRVADKPIPYVPSEKTECGKCGAEVWFDPKAIEKYAAIGHEVGGFVCLPCMAKEITPEEMMEAVKAGLDAGVADGYDPGAN